MKRVQKPVTTMGQFGYGFTDDVAEISCSASPTTLKSFAGRIIAQNASTPSRLEFTRLLPGKRLAVLSIPARPEFLPSPLNHHPCHKVQPNSAGLPPLPGPSD